MSVSSDGQSVTYGEWVEEQPDGWINKWHEAVLVKCRIHRHRKHMLNSILVALPSMFLTYIFIIYYFISEED